MLIVNNYARSKDSNPLQGLVEMMQNMVNMKVFEMEIDPIKSSETSASTGLLLLEKLFYLKNLEQLRLKFNDCTELIPKTASKLTLPILELTKLKTYTIDFNK